MKVTIKRKLFYASLLCPGTWSQETQFGVLALSLTSHVKIKPTRYNTSRFLCCFLKLVFLDVK